MGQVSGPARPKRGYKTEFRIHFEPQYPPLVRESDAHDTILVQINPRERTDVPRTANDVLDRLNEISFNSPLMKELRMIALLRQVADPGHGEGARWAGMRPTGSGLTGLLPMAHPQS